MFLPQSLITSPKLLYFVLIYFTVVLRPNIQVHGFVLKYAYVKKKIK